MPINGSRRVRLLLRLHARQGGQCAYCLRPLYWPPKRWWVEETRAEFRAEMLESCLYFAPGCHAGGLPESLWPSFLSCDRITIDHVIPVSAGGDDAEDNLVAACLSCNAAKCDRVVAPRVERVA